MQIKFLHIFLGLSIGVLAICAPFSSAAQSENDPNAGESKELIPESSNDDKPLIFEHDSKSARVRDSLHFRSSYTSVTKGKSTDQAKPSTKEDDVLSFNFLYYIIQKFKISDLIDE